jgi:hypothetical protein
MEHEPERGEHSGAGDGQRLEAARPEDEDGDGHEEGQDQPAAGVLA